MHQQKSPTNYAVTSAAPTKKKQYYYLSYCRFKRPHVDYSTYLR